MFLVFCRLNVKGPVKYKYLLENILWKLENFSLQIKLWVC